ncbi:MAG: GNAT family N-acetyltransferase [Lewinella sp.]|uniref:GNAT family N-acetyltransferase n=1 Tax=Lewinella sp. TaxID=2004506 RepID=UPI003D6C60A2
MEKITSYTQLEKVLLSLKSQNTLTNDFNLKSSYQQYIDDRRLHYVLENDNLFLLLDKGGFFQAYFHINNDQVTHFPNDLEIAVEIPYRNYPNRPDNQIAYLRSVGFVDHIERHLYTARFQDCPELNGLGERGMLKVIEDTIYADYVHGLIADTFDRYTGDILNRGEIIARIKNGEVLAIFEDDKPVAFLEFYVKGKVAWIGHIAVDRNNRGQGYGTVLVKTYIKMLFERGISRFHHWVMADNKKALAMYSKMGFIYGNKSSFSMLKKEC